ncbi:MAG: hypothetical protein P4N59_13580 [Negativicutes bacterium]|nr:hypothetical protein [Negativicutes bacterium]
MIEAPIGSSQEGSSRWIGGLRWLLAASTLMIGLYVAVCTVIMVIESWTPLPFWDQWNELISGREITWSWLVSQHNEHRILFPRLIFIIDRWLAGETNLVDFAANITIQAGLVVLIYSLAQGAGLRAWWEKIWAGGLSLTLLFWSGQYENFVWGFQVQFFGVVLAAGGAFASLALSRGKIAGLMPSIILEIVSVYTLSSGIVVPFLSILLAILLGRSRLIVAILTIVAFSLLGCYLIGYHTPAGHSNPLEALHHLESIVTYVFVELGGPIGNTIGGVFGGKIIPAAAVAGIIGGMMFSIIGWTMILRRHSTPPHQVVFLSLAGFVLAMTILTATGRVGFGPEQALSSRYATPTMAFWVSLILLAAARSRCAGQTRTAVMVLALTFQSMIALSESHFAAIGRSPSVGQIRAIPAILANVADLQYLKAIYPDPRFPLSASSVLRSSHTSIFSDKWANWLGTPLADHVVFADDALCQGSFDRAEKVADGPSSGWRATGQAWLAIWGKAPGKILLGDASGRVVGYGIGGFDLPSLGIPQDKQKAGWVGAFTSASPESVVAFALVDDGPVVCRLGSARSVVLPTKLTVLDSHPSELPYGGAVDSVTIGDGVEIDGWGLLLGPDSVKHVIVDTNLKIRSAEFSSRPRPDVVLAYNDLRLADAGFSVRLEVDPASVRPKNVRLCVWTDDPVFGSHLLRGPFHPDLCPEEGK